MELTQIAQNYASAGLSVIPCMANKRPALKGSWNPYKSKIMSPDIVSATFNKAAAIGIICGQVSGNIEVVDVDTKYSSDPDLFPNLWRTLTDYFDGAPPLVLAQTISGGYHIIYKAANIESGKKLAGKKNKDGKKDYFLETRGEGHYIIAAPSKGYKIISGDYTKIPLIKNHDRDFIINHCKSLTLIQDDSPKTFDHKGKKFIQGKELKSNFNPENSIYEVSPWEAYDMDSNEPWRQLLIDEGWTKTGTKGIKEYWKRPGSENAQNANFDFERRLFYNFSPNGDKIDQDTAYSPAAIYSALKCNGDFTQTAQELEAAGYGERKNIETDGLNSSNEVFQHVLSLIKPQNFREYANKSVDGKLLKKHFLIGVIEILLQIIKKNGVDLCIHDSGTLFLYSNGFWATVSENDLKNFLGIVAEKMGVNKFDSKHFSFRDDLLKQFHALAYLPEKKKSNRITLLNVQNGTLEITKKGVNLRDHDKNDFLKYKLDFDYDPNASCPIFIKFLNRVQADTNNQMIMSEFIGYCFLKWMKLEKSLYLFGTGANGKSLFFDVIKALFGINNVTSYSVKSLTNDPCYRAKIMTSLVNFVTEMDCFGDKEALKQLISGETVQARILYKGPFEMSDYARLIFSGNKFPTDVEHTHAFFRRFLIIPFTVTISDTEADPLLASKIIANELPGVLNWVIAGIKRLIENKAFTKSDSASDLLQDFKTTSDSVGMFLRDNKKQVDSLETEDRDGNRFIPLKDIYPCYRHYIQLFGFKAVSNRSFCERMVSHGFLKGKKKYGVVLYVTSKYMGDAGDDGDAL